MNCSYELIHQCCGFKSFHSVKIMLGLTTNTMNVDIFAWMNYHELKNVVNFAWT